VLLGPALHPDRLRPGAPAELVPHGAFAQVHRGQAARIQERVEGVVAPLPGRRILELYAGTGGMGLALAAAGARVTAVEAFPAAGEALRAAARDQRIDAMTGVDGDATRVAASLAAQGERFDAAVANPPRRGLPPALRRLLTSLAGRIVYVSCEPETLARDLDHLRRLGFAGESVAPYDMIPLSGEVECVTVLHRAAAPAPRIVHEDEWLLAVEKPPFEPTTPHGEHPGSLLERVRRLPGAASAVPVHRLDAGTSGVCLFARGPAEAAELARALAASDALKQYQALVRGVTRARGQVTRPLLEEGRMLPARTRYRRVAVTGGHSLLQVFPETGRTHQIRRHLAGIGHPVLGDARHGHAASNRHLFERCGLDRPFLHLATIELTHPRSGERQRLAAPLPGDLAAVLARNVPAP
jgi:23S rRNA (uracil1939-C5)-methyltransferase